jgi:hypothetical protein
MLNPTAFDESPIFRTASADAGNPSIAYIRGNYGGLTAKTLTGTTYYVLAIPSIVTNSGTTAGNALKIESNALSGTLLFNGKTLSNATTYNPAAKVVFSGSSLPASSTAISDMVTALKAAYSSTPDIAGNTSVASLLSATGATAVASLGTSIVSNQLGGKISTSDSANQNLLPTGISVLTCLTANSVLVSSSAYAGCATSDIIICS